MSYTEHAPKSYVDSKLALKADVVALQAVSAIATALDTRLSQLARDTYTKTQIDYLTDAIKKGRFKKVDSLPEIEEAELYVIYLVPRSDPEARNVKDEYIVIVGDGGARSWEKVGSTDVDLSGYATLDDLTSSASAILGTIDNLRDYATGAINNITGVEIPRLESGIQGAASEANSAKSTANSVAAYAAQIESKADKNASDISDLSDEVDDKQPALSPQQLANIAAVPNKANDADVVHKTGDETIAGVKTFSDGIWMGSDITLDYYKLYFGGLLDVYAVVGLGDEVIFIDPRTDAELLLKVGNGGQIAHGDAIAPSFSEESTYAVGEHVMYAGLLYRCTTAVTTAGSWDASKWTADTASNYFQYALTTKTISNNAVTLDDRAHNVATVAAPGSGNTTTITAALPPIVQGKSRDMFLNLTVGTQASDAGDISLSIVEPSGATVQIDIGSVEDIGIGKNEILISENALPTTSGNVTTTHWLVTVRHEDFAS